MPYVERDQDGRVLALHEAPDSKAGEYLPFNHPDISSYLEGMNATDLRQLLELSDFDIIRIAEDLVDTLITMNVIKFTDLPPQAQNKLRTRKALRQNLSSLANLVSEDDDIL